MANYSHLKKIDQGVNAWNEWRKDEPSIKPDLSNADLSRKELDGIDLSGANLTNTKFRNSTIRKSDFSNSIIKKANFYGSIASEADFTFTKAEYSRFMSADLKKTNFSHSDLKYSKFEGAILTDAKFKKTELKGVDLTGTDDSFSNWKMSFWGKPIFQDYFFDIPIESVLGLTPRTRRMFADAQYLNFMFDRGRGLRKIWLYIWGITCGYGQNMKRWLFTSILLIFIFTLVNMNTKVYVSNFSAPDTTSCYDRGSSLSGKILNPSFERSLYFSIVTFTTLGYGDMTPITFSGRMLLCVEVFVGYMMLGGLISIFAGKLARLS